MLMEEALICLKIELGLSSSAHFQDRRFDGQHFPVIAKVRLAVFELGLGVSPIQAPKWHPDLNPPGSGTRGFVVAGDGTDTEGRRLSAQTFIALPFRNDCTFELVEPIGQGFDLVDDRRRGEVGGRG